MSLDRELWRRRATTALLIASAAGFVIALVFPNPGLAVGCVVGAAGVLLADYSARTRPADAVRVGLILGRPERRFQKLFAWGCLVVLLCVGLWGMTAAWHKRSLLQPLPHGVTTTGRVADMTTDTSGGGTSYNPIIIFTDGAGQEHRFTAPWTSDRPTVGATVRVSYDPRNPERAHDLDGNRAIWTNGFGFSVVFTAIMLLAFAGLVALNARLRREAIRVAERTRTRPDYRYVHDPEVLAGPTAGQRLGRAGIIGVLGMIPGWLVTLVAPHPDRGLSAVAVAGLVWIGGVLLVCLSLIVRAARFQRREQQAGYTTLREYKKRNPELFLVNPRTKQVIERPYGEPPAPR